MVEDECTFLPYSFARTGESRKRRIHKFKKEPFYFVTCNFCFRIDHNWIKRSAFCHRNQLGHSWMKSNCLQVDIFMCYFLSLSPLCLYCDPLHPHPNDLVFHFKTRVKSNCIYKTVFSHSSHLNQLQFIKKMCVWIRPRSSDQWHNWPVRLLPLFTWRLTKLLVVVVPSYFFISFSLTLIRWIRRRSKKIVKKNLSMSCVSMAHLQLRKNFVSSSSSSYSFLPSQVTSSCSFLFRHGLH